MARDGVEEIVNAIRGNDLNRASLRINERAEALDSEWLAALIDFLESGNAGVDAGRVHGIREQIEYRLALRPGRQFAEAAVAVARLPQILSLRYKATPSHLTEVAWRLAATQSDEVLAALEAELGAEPTLLELFAEWLHASVVGGKDLRALPSARRIQERLRAQEHPLSALPLALLPCERKLPSRVARYFVDQSAAEINAAAIAAYTAAGADAEPSVSPHWAEWSGGRIVETTASADISRIVTAISPRTSNWKVEARTFDVEDAPVDVGPQLLAALGLDSVWREPPSSCAAVALPAVVESLFSVGAYGGAYGPQRGPGLGRLAMWCSIAGLIGIAGAIDVAAIAALGERCRWTVFASDAGWFESLGWDLGIAVRRPDDRGVAVLAATDTD
jgi:uncharacterized protein DUF6183